MRVTRTITYDGPEEWVLQVLGNSLADGTHTLGQDKKITLETNAAERTLPEGIWPLGREADPRREV